LGNCPKCAKTILITKNNSAKESAKELSKNTSIKITDQGECHLGAVIGIESFSEQFIKNKVEGWVNDIQLLSNYAQDDPQVISTWHASSVFFGHMCLIL